MRALLIIIGAVAAVTLAWRLVELPWAVVPVAAILAGAGGRFAGQLCRRR